MSALELAEKYISDHNCPALKSELFGTKLFLEPLNEGQEALQEKCLSAIEKVLRQDRVDRRLARSTAEWIPEQNVAVVTKTVGALMSAFGLHNKNGKFLGPEEAVFLLEINKLELTYKNVPVSIQEIFKNVNNFNFAKYLTYKKLVLQGYKLKSSIQPGNAAICPNVKQSKSKSKKQSSSGAGEPPTKIPRLESSETNNMADIFQKLRQNGPQSYQNSDCSSSPTYCFSVSSNSGKSERFNLIINENEEFGSIVGDDTSSDIHALCLDDNVSFYKFVNNSVPVL